MTAAGRVEGRQLDWLLVDFVRSTAGARHALVVSADGLRLAASQDIVEALGEQLGAGNSALTSPAPGASALPRAGPPPSWPGRSARRSSRWPAATCSSPRSAMARCWPCWPSGP